MVCVCLARRNDYFFWAACEFEFVRVSAISSSFCGEAAYFRHGRGRKGRPSRKATQIQARWEQCQPISDARPGRISTLNSVRARTVYTHHSSRYLEGTTVWGLAKKSRSDRGLGETVVHNNTYIQVNTLLKQHDHGDIPAARAKGYCVRMYIPHV